MTLGLFSNIKIEKINPQIIINKILSNKLKSTLESNSRYFIVVGRAVCDSFKSTEKSLNSFNNNMDVGTDFIDSDFTLSKNTENSVVLQSTKNQITFAVNLIEIRFNSDKGLNFQFVKRLSDVRGDSNHEKIYVQEPKLLSYDEINYVNFIANLK